MGRMLGQMPDLDPRFWEIPDRLREARAGLDELQQLIRESPAAAREIGRDLVQAEMRYGDLVSEYQRIHTLIFGEPAPGLGAVPLAAWIVAAIAAALLALERLIRSVAEYKERVFQVTYAERTGGTLPPRTFTEQFGAITEYLPWLGVALAAMFLLPLFTGRRR